MRDSHTRAASILQSFGFAFRGLWTAWVDERNFRIQVSYGSLVAVALICLQPPIVMTAVVLLSVVVLISAELANSSLERVVDLVSPESHPMAAAAKDMAAAGVMLVSFASASIVLMTLTHVLSREGVFALGGVFLWIMMRRFGGGYKR